jgi:hypothetical protein
LQVRWRPVFQVTEEDEVVILLSFDPRLPQARTHDERYARKGNDHQSDSDGQHDGCPTRLDVSEPMATTEEADDPSDDARRPRQPVSDPGSDERISLAPLTAEEAVKALPRTPPPSKANGKEPDAKSDEKP